jgi:hypothetical protein
LSSAPPSPQQEADRFLHGHRREIEREMMCSVDRVEVDREQRYALVSIPKYHATDMGGCIRAVQWLAPWVTRVDVFAGGEPDTRYEWDGRRWQAWRIEWKSK